MVELWLPQLSGTTSLSLRATRSPRSTRLPRSAPLVLVATATAAANGDHAYQALVKAVATRTNMELIDEDEDKQLVALNDRLVVPESWGNHNSTMPSWKGSCRIRTIHPLSRTQAKMPKAETIEAE